MASCTSPPASARIFPASRATRCDSSALRSASTAPAAAMISARAGTGTRAQSRCAAAAAATARSTSAAVPAGYVADDVVGSAGLTEVTVICFLLRMVVASGRSVPL